MALAIAVDQTTEQSSAYENALWKDKCERLSMQLQDMQKRNEELEDRLLNMVEKTEGDKILLSDEIDELSNRLIKVNGVKARLEQECARYKSDCVLAVHLLHCQPSHYVAKKKLDHAAMTDDTSSFHGADDQEENVSRKFVTSTVSTFPPMAYFYKPEAESDQPEDPQPSGELLGVTVVKPDETAAGLSSLAAGQSSLTSEFVERIRADTNYKCVDLLQCKKCGSAVAMATKETQTIARPEHQGDPYRFPPVHERRVRVRSSDSNTSSETAI
uniref:Tight junction-associated protein 1 n=1 Tax=Plectus sambesii TaxID=2011161 RepID=A0A914WFV4_9BILA